MSPKYDFSDNFLLVLARLDANGALVVEAQRARVLAHAQLAQLLQEDVPRQHNLVLHRQARVRIEVVERPLGRIPERGGAEIEAALLERHERGGRKEAVAVWGEENILFIIILC